jgi:hypothetical protein
VIWLRHASSHGDLLATRSLSVTAAENKSPSELSVVLDRSQIIEQGTHQALLGLGGTYARLWQHQSGGFLDEEANPRMLTTAQ